MIGKEKMGHFRPKDGTFSSPSWDTGVPPVRSVIDQVKDPLSLVGVASGKQPLSDETLAACKIPPEMLAELLASDHPRREAVAGGRESFGSDPRYIRHASLPWLLAASTLSPGALKAGLAIWYLAGLCQTRKDLALPPRLWEEWFDCRKTFYRAVDALERAGLITVTRHKGRSPVVTLCPPPERDPVI